MDSLGPARVEMPFRTLYVRRTWVQRGDLFMPIPGAFPTLAAALDGAVPGDRIRVAADHAEYHPKHLT